MNQPVKRPDMRSEMPETAKWVDEKRAEFGKDHVDACIKAAIKGVPGRFFAIEGGHVLGVPFPATDVRSQYQDIAIVTGTRWAGFIATPGEINGAH